MTSHIQHTDRLAKRGAADKSGFLTFAFAGAVGIFSAKAVGLSGNFVAVGASAAMIIYALLLRRGGPNRLRADQAGDNCYYLGLIYTLASLAHAIATFDPDRSASGIVQSFGVALATTILGLILRVAFSQARPDLENVEEQSRLEMTDAVARLKAQLGDCVRQFNDFSREIQQSISELHDSTSESIGKLTDEMVGGISEVVEEATSTIRQEANDFATRSKRYSISFEKLLGKLDQHAASLESLTGANSRIQGAAEAANHSASSAAQSIDHFRQIVQDSRSAVVVTGNAVQQMQGAASGLTKSVESMEAAIERMHAQTDQRLEQLMRGPGTGMLEVNVALVRAAEDLRAQIAQTGALHAEVHAGMTARNQSALEAAQRLNEQLEAEVARSAQLVAKVHGSLSDMTGRLAETVEGIS
jgi:hypothetical protein